MNKIWANRLIAGTQTWADVPVFRRDGVKTELSARVATKKITADRYAEITGEEYTSHDDGGAY